MRFSPLIAPIAVLLVIAYNQTFAGSNQQPEQSQALSNPVNDAVEKVAQSYHKNWRKLNWTLGENGIPASNNPAFDEGIQRVCQAKAELFFEGYQITPFIESDSQQQIFPIIFRPTVEEIKAQIRVNLPKLRLI